MRTTPEQLQHSLTEPEGARVEFNEAKSNYHFEKLLDYCVALANEGGSKIALAVTDRRPIATPTSQLKSRQNEVARQVEVALYFIRLPHLFIYNHSVASCNQEGGHA
jgi:hypothetical protein